MSKIICDICGTTYPETADCCPICGCSRNPSENQLADDLLEGMENGNAAAFSSCFIFPVASS